MCRNFNLFLLQLFINLISTFSELAKRNNKKKAECIILHHQCKIIKYVSKTKGKKNEQTDYRKKDIYQT